MRTEGANNLMAKPIGNGADQTDPAQLLNVEALAEYIGCSAKAVYQMESYGRIPRGMRLSGGIVRWSRKAIEQWVADGCPSCREKT